LRTNHSTEKKEKRCKGEVNSTEKTHSQKGKGKRTPYIPTTSEKETQWFFDGKRKKKKTVPGAGEGGCWGCGLGPKVSKGRVGGERLKKKLNG